MGAESRIWMVVAFIFIAASIVLGILWFIQRSEDEFDKEAFLSRNKDAILAAFPSHFLSEEEKDALQEAYMRLITDPDKTYPLSDDSFRARFCPATQCNNGTESTELSQRRRAENNSYQNQAEPDYENTVHHVCCESNITFISPEVAVNSENKTVPLVNFSDKKQWFPSETCRNSTIFGMKCPFCTCMQRQTAGHAVVLVDTREIKLDWVILPGCCKCVNK